MKPLPKALQRWAAANPDKFEEGHTEQDSWAYDGSWSHWLYLKKGWINPDTESHIIHEPTVKEAITQLKRIQPCHCDDCRVQ